VHIVHSNIHPQNILYHPQKKKLFLSDFRYARYLKTPVGQKVPTQLVGHLNYSNDDMVNIFNGEGKEVDLFLNDIHGLKTSFAHVKLQTDGAKKKKLGKDTWEVDLGDLFGEFRALYHNLGRIQPKL
jgi:hypothetical protein